MAKKHEVGDVHAPVEDIEVPFSLKVLVFVMFLIVTGAVAAVVLATGGLERLLPGM